MGWSFPLPLNIPQHLLQTTRELVPVASQWQSVGNSRGLAVSQARGCESLSTIYSSCSTTAGGLDFDQFTV